MAFSLNDYSGVHKIGEGGMGKVYLATQIALERRVVIKEIAADLRRDPALVQRFENEAKLAASLEHDNIIRVYDFGEDSGFFYIAMEYVDGPDLEQLLSEERLPREIGLMAVLHALKGLHFAHIHGIAHGDVKPDNILVSRTGRVKITDFGLSYLNARAAGFPAAGTVFLTPAYMPPEQAKEIQGQEIAEESFVETIPAFQRETMIAPPNGMETAVWEIRRDIWSVGVMLYRVLSGRFPFSGGNISLLAQSIENESAPPIRQIVPYLPENLEACIDACLKKEPWARPATLAPLIDSLENFFFDIGIRDTEKEIGKFFADGPAAVAGLEKLMAGYHIRVSEEYLAGGDVFKSDVHFMEAEKNIAPDKNNRANGGTGKPAKPAPGRGSKTQRVPVISKKVLQRRAPTAKSKVLTAMMEIVAVLFLASFGATGSFVLVRKILERTHPLPRPAVAAVVHHDTALPGTMPPADTHVVVEKADDPPPLLSADTAHKLQDIAKMEYMEKNRSSRPGHGKTAAQSGTLKIAVVPFPATVYLDGDERRSLEKLARGVRMSAGAHIIAAVADGFEPYFDWITVVKDSVTAVQIELKPLGKTGSMLDVSCYPQSTIYVDGITRGLTPKTVSLSEGPHLVMLHRDGYEPYSQSVTVAPGKPVTVQVRLEKEEQRNGD
jgi:serine/threonine protein kinase